MESDEGTFKPSGLAFTGNAKARDIIKEIMALLLPINVTDVFDNADGTDINYWMRDGVPGENTLQKKTFLPCSVTLGGRSCSTLAVWCFKDSRKHFPSRNNIYRR